MSITPELQQAIDGLRILDIFLRSTRVECAEGFLAKYEDCTSLTVQQMHAVRKAEQLEGSDATRRLMVHILVGTRWASPAVADAADAKIDVKALIEAEFIAEYAISGALSDDALAEFATKNASFHVWPYWRELLAAHCERLRLPRLTLPVMQLPHHRIPPAATDKVQDSV